MVMLSSVVVASLHPTRSFRGGVVAKTRGYPAVLRCDNGPELACEAMADWAGEHVVLPFIPPGEPWRNGYLESCT